MVIDDFFPFPKKKARSSISLRSYASFVETLKNSSQEVRDNLARVWIKARGMALAPTQTHQELYCGVPTDVYTLFKMNNFAGAIRKAGLREVCLTQNIRDAHKVGYAQLETGEPRKIITCYMDTSKAMDATSPPEGLSGFAIELFNSHHGTNDLSMTDSMWTWVFARSEFASEMRRRGIVAAKFRPSRDAQEVYTVFQPNAVKVSHSALPTVKDFYLWLKKHPEELPASE